MQNTKDKTKKASGTFFIAKKIMPEGDNQSSVLPSDQWMVKNLWKSARSSKSFLKHAGHTAAHAAMSVASFATIAVGAVLVASTNIAFGAILAGAIGLRYFGKKTKDKLTEMKKQHVPHIQKDMKSRLLKYKADQFMSAMKANLAEQQKEQEPAEKTKTSYKSGLFSGLFKKSAKTDAIVEKAEISAANNNNASASQAKNNNIMKK